MKCLLCDSKDTSVAFHLPGAPRYSQKLLTADEAARLGRERFSVDLYQCARCGMIQIDSDKLSHNEYWGDYLNSRAATQLYVEYDKSLADTLVGRYGLKGKTCVEVGCGDGYFSAELMARGMDVVAIEPSAKACKVAAERGVKCVNAYLDDQIDRHISQKFDAFVCKQVMDLVKDANGLLRNLGRLLKPGAVGLIDVPSWTKTLLDKRYYSVLPDRVGYYTARTLLEILERNNFHVVEIFHGAEDEYVGAYVRYEGATGAFMRSFTEDFTRFNDVFHELVGAYRARGKALAGWGAGAKGVTIFAFSNVSTETIQYVIDRDQNRWGLYMPGTLLPVVAPDTLRERPVDGVIITAAMFYKEIVRDLVREFAFAGDMIVLSPLPHALSRPEIDDILAE
jgi:2-polyprenyl-3-methyl-5-hydroxy-6-metoxy-1,4-benzoquinol methylase